jgi:DNA-directed RNA polymerase subunit RPC12/RpoP
MNTGETCPRCGHELELLSTDNVRDHYCPECDERRIAPSKRSPFSKGWDTAEFCDPRARRANEYPMYSPDWHQWENGYSEYWNARGQMQEDDD